MMCPHCGKELPKMTEEDAKEVLEELKNIPGFMRKLGEEAAKYYISTGKLKL